MAMVAPLRALTVDVLDCSFTVLPIPLIGRGRPVGGESAVEDKTGGAHASAKVLDRREVTHVGGVHVEAFKPERRASWL